MIHRIEWNDHAANGLRRALTTPVLAIVEREVRSGVSMLWECKTDKHHAYCVTRIDQNPLEWVFVAFEGTGLEMFAKDFIAAADQRRIPIRLHTTSEVLLRLVRRLGFQRREFVAVRAA